ncbi:eCIS core domain-containing protein [Paractinoplanes rishiriensis]|nr:DUF4157 domain-containing protein [Actinoplanes rishiriensis]
MASAITGRARAPLFTAGPNTTRALAAAGALGATTGTVVHLPAVPTSAPAVSAVLAHELAHTRSPVRRPRFLLSGASGLLDDDERQALAAGRDRFQQGAGIVDSLPVGGGMGAVGEVATRAARQAVIEAAGSPLGAAMSGGGLGSLGGLAGNFGPGGAVDGAMSQVAGGVGSAMNSVNDAVSGVTGTIGGISEAAGNVLSAASGEAKGALDPDQVVEIVERRLLREIERRGGRWAGVF